MQGIRALAALAVLALSSHTVSAASLATNTSSNNSSSSTVFLDTEYNPKKCTLQLASLECLTDKKDMCGELNGYPLECVKLGRLNGKDKYACQCRANETDVCQGSVAPTLSGAYQFDTCSEQKPCVSSYGHVPSEKELRICAERLHCVKEINTTASEPAQICHTCRSCIVQNDAANTQLADKRRFDCTRICPKAILDSLATRNEQGVGIAGEVNSEEDSGFGSEGSDEGSGEGESEGSTEGTSKATDGSNDATVSSSALAATIVLTALSAVFLH